MEMETVVDCLQAKFQKADSDLKLISSKLELHNYNKKSPKHLLQFLHSLNEEFTNLMEEWVKILNSQKEALLLLREELPVVLKAVQALQHHLNIQPSQDSDEAISGLIQKLGITMESQSVHNGDR